MNVNEKKDKIKQIILVRKDLKMASGKIASQVADGCMKVFFQKLTKTENNCYTLSSLPYFDEYINGAFTKIVVKVKDEEELLDLYHKAIKQGIHASLIKDAGLTAFNNVPTHTTVALGPWKGSDLDELTGHLSLL